MYYTMCMDVRDFIQGYPGVGITHRPDLYVNKRAHFSCEFTYKEYDIITLFSELTDRLPHDSIAHVLDMYALNSLKIDNSYMYYGINRVSYSDRNRIHKVIRITHKQRERWEKYCSSLPIKYYSHCYRYLVVNYCLIAIVDKFEIKDGRVRAIMEDKPC